MALASEVVGLTRAAQPGAFMLRPTTRVANEACEFPRAALAISHTKQRRREIPCTVLAFAGHSVGQIPQRGEVRSSSSAEGRKGRTRPTRGRRNTATPARVRPILARTGALGRERLTPRR